MKIGDCFKSIVIEFRPRIQSIYFLIILKEKGNDVNIELQNSIVKMIINNVPYEINLFTSDIIDSSISNLQISDRYLTFRIATNQKNGMGSFKTELLTVFKNGCPNKKNNNVPPIDDYSVYCKNCTNPLVNSTRFKRILPLPSDDCTPDNWFCHKPEGQNIISLTPKLDDLFYSECFVHINSKLFKGCICLDNILKCESCDAWIGINLSDSTYKVWYNTITLKSVKQKFETDPIEDVFITLRMLQKNNICPSKRYIFECPLSKKEICYVLLWIMEESLPIHIYDGNGDKKEYQSCKVLYKIECEETDEIRVWQKMINVSIVTISKCMIDGLIRHLNDMKEYLPDNLNVSNQFYLSYLLMN